MHTKCGQNQKYIFQTQHFMYVKYNFQAAMLFSSVTFGFALFSYAFQTYAKLSEETMKYLHEKTEAATKAAANAAMGELGDFADRVSLTGRMSKIGSTGGLSSHKSDTESTPEESEL